MAFLQAIEQIMVAGEVKIGWGGVVGIDFEESGAAAVVEEVTGCDVVAVEPAVADDEDSTSAADSSLVQLSSGDVEDVAH